LKIFFVTIVRLVPGLDRFHDLGRYVERGVDLAVHRFGYRSLPDFEHAAIGGGQNNGRHLMSAELLAKRPPGSVNPGFEESMLDGRQQMIGQYTKEDVRLGAVLEVMKNGPLHQWTLDVAEGIFHASQQNVEALHRPSDPAGPFSECSCR